MQGNVVDMNQAHAGWRVTVLACCGSWLSAAWVTSRNCKEISLLIPITTAGMPCTRSTVRVQLCDLGRPVAPALHALQWHESRFVMMGVELTEHDIVMMPGGKYLTMGLHKPPPGLGWNAVWAGPELQTGSCRFAAEKSALHLKQWASNAFSCHPVADAELASLPGSPSVADALVAGR